MSRTLAIRAMTCLRAGDPDGALDALRACWAAQGGMTQEQIEVSRYPKHSGDVMLLARIYRAQGRLAEARELASRTVGMRRGVYGDGAGPRVADSLFTVGRMLEVDGGELVLAGRVMREVVEMCEGVMGLEGHLARGLWFLAGVEERIGEGKGVGGEDERVGGRRKVVEELRERAKTVRRGIENREWPDEDSDEGFMRLVSWMLW